MRDPYSILGVRQDADSGEIKAAWRQKAKTLHPDANQEDPNASQKFAEAGRAYEVLKDQAKRERYDHMRAKAQEQGQTIMQQRAAAREAAERARQAKANAEAVMAELAKVEAEREKVRQAQAAREQAEKAKADAAKAKQAKPAEKDGPDRPAASAEGPSAAEPQAGAEAQPQQTTAQPDSDAAKAGPKAPEDIVTEIFGNSPEAQAAAESLRREADDLASEEARLAGPFDFLNLIVRRLRGAPPPSKAPDLKVDAQVTIEDLIEKRTVTATLPDGRTVRVALEGGISDGDTVVLKGQGLRLQGMTRGDVVATVRVGRSEQFRVDGLDLRTVLPVTLENAVLGCDMTVETPTGPTDITVPAWSGSDQVLTLEGHGLPDGEGGRGNLKVELRVILWEKPDEKVTDLMRLMREGLYL